MRIRIAVPDEHVTPDVINPVLEAVTRLNDHMITSGQTPTSHELLRAGARWRPENMGDEHFDHGATIASRGWGDCDDWAPLHASTLRTSGRDPGARAIVIPSGPNTFHAVVQRSDGSIEDPSVAAGMKAPHPANISGPAPETMEVWACDPHDGRIYQGALAPTVGPITMHCGPGIAVRGCRVSGHGPLYEARVDVPIEGSRLVRVRSFTRHHPRRVCHGHMPYALSITHMAPSRELALHGAIIGAMFCGDASEMTTAIDRYKLLALQHAMSGASPGQVHDMLVNQMHADMLAASQASGQHPEVHSKELLAQTFPPPMVVGGFLSDLGHIASSVVSDVSKVASSVAKTALPWAGDIIHGVQAAVSVVPGLGTAVSDIVAAAETAYESAAALLTGNPLEAGLHAAYNFATATVPGASALRPILDPVVNTLINMAGHKEPLDSAILDGLLAQVPDAPKIGSLSPRSVAASLAHLLVSHLGVKHSKTAPPPKSKPAAKPKPPPPHLAPPAHLAPAVLTALHQAMTVPAIKPVAPVHVMPMPARAAPAPAPVKPGGPAHAAVHRVTMQSIDTLVQHV